MKLDYFKEETVDQLVQMAAEYEDLEDAREAHATPPLFSVLRAFEAACLGALHECLAGGKTSFYYLKENLTPQDLMDAEGPYLILMTLEGHGVGIWDGSWDEFFVNPKRDIPDVQKHLKNALCAFADCTGGGILPEQFRTSAFISLGLNPFSELDTCDKCGKKLDEDDFKGGYCQGFIEDDLKDCFHKISEGKISHHNEQYENFDPTTDPDFTGI